MPLRYAFPARRAALLALIAAGIAFAASLRAAIMVGAYSTSFRASDAASTRPQNGAPPRAGATPEEIAAALEADPFHPERRRPDVRFTLDAESAPAAEPQPAGLVPPPPPLRLLGTTVWKDGGFAVVERQGVARVLRMGQPAEGLTLKKVSRASAVVVDGDAMVTLRLPGMDQR